MSRAWTVVAFIFAVFVVVLGWAIPMFTSAPYPGILFAPLTVGTVAAVVGIALLAHGRTRLAGVALLVTTVAVPTFFAAALNVPLLVLALLLIVRSPQRSPATA